jgi:amidase
VAQSKRLARGIETPAVHPDRITALDACALSAAVHRRELSCRELMQACLARFHRHMVSLFDRFDLLVLPSVQVWPFPAEWTWPREVAGRTMASYRRWMEVVIYATPASLPAMSVPVGFNDAGLPMGMQLIGPPLGDLAVLNAAAAYETSIGELLACRPVID